ncbi:hypothetical protein HY492_01380 [Candidatus Woesearchaeota archaeon]|nr:hypothetical protein [Candidatus Woesearchaeota archaeon]
MTQTQEPTFSELLAEHKRPVAKAGPLFAEQMVQRMRVLSQATPYRQERRFVNEAMDALVRDYFRAQLGSVYSQRVDLDALRELKRPIKLNPEKHFGLNDKISLLSQDVVEIARVAVAHLGEEYAIETDKIRAKDRSGYACEVQYRVVAAAPLIPTNVKNAGVAAMTLAYEVCAKALHEPAVLDYVVSNTGAPDIGALVKPGLEVLWIPSESALHVETTVKRIDPDPALVLRFHNDHFLVATWNIAEEEPLEHLLREYSITHNERHQRQLYEKHES